MVSVSNINFLEKKVNKQQSKIKYLRLKRVGRNFFLNFEKFDQPLDVIYIARQSLTLVPHGLVIQPTSIIVADGLNIEVFWEVKIF